MKKDLLAQIKKHDTIIIHRHQKPDGDALGSQLGLKEIIQENFPEKKVLAVGSKEEYSENSIKNIFKDEFDTVKEADYKEALTIITDTANLDRIEGIDFFRGNEIFKVDHHASGEVYGSFEWVEPKISSASEMIAEWARTSKLKVNEQAAKYLLTGMITDTGRFMFNSVTAETLDEAHYLMLAGAKISTIANKLNDRNVNFVRLQGHVLSNFEFKKGVSYYQMPKDTHKKFGVDYNSASSMVFLLMQFAEADYAVFSSYDNENKVWKGSLRSRKKPINLIAEKFDGGGHEMAAGFKLKDPKQFKEVVEQLKKLNKEKKEDGRIWRF